MPEMPDIDPNTLVWIWIGAGLAIYFLGCIVALLGCYGSDWCGQWLARRRERKAVERIKPLRRREPEEEYLGCDG